MLYDYTCQACGAVVSLFSSVEDRDNRREHICNIISVSEPDEDGKVMICEKHDAGIPPPTLKRHVGYAWSYTPRIGAFGAFYSEMGPDPV